MTTTLQKSGLTLHELELNVTLGWPEEERQQKQLVKLDATIHFAKPPAACISDDLADTFSYDSLIKNIQLKTADQSFQLLEHLGYEIYQVIKAFVPDSAKVNISIKKQPAIAALTGGASFYFGD